jgi:hypothetical protein
MSHDVWPPPLVCLAASLPLFIPALQVQRRGCWPAFVWCSLFFGGL